MNNVNSRCALRDDSYVSLIHDDLPGTMTMTSSWSTTVHKAFDEATAISCGMHTTLAFLRSGSGSQLTSNNYRVDCFRYESGMISGQMKDS